MYVVYRGFDNERGFNQVIVLYRYVYNVESKAIAIGSDAVCSDEALRGSCVKVTRRFAPKRILKRLSRLDLMTDRKGRPVRYPYLNKHYGCVNWQVQNRLVLSIDPAIRSACEC